MGKTKWKINKLLRNIFVISSPKTTKNQLNPTFFCLDPQRRISGSGPMAGTGNGNTMPITTPGPTPAGPGGLSNSIGNNPQSVDSGIGLGSPRSITSASSTTLYSPKIQGTSPSLLPGSDNSPEKATSGSSWGHLTSFFHFKKSWNKLWKSFDQKKKEKNMKRKNERKKNQTTTKQLSGQI